MGGSREGNDLAATPERPPTPPPSSLDVVVTPKDLAQGSMLEPLPSRPWAPFHDSPVN